MKDRRETENRTQGTAGVRLNKYLSEAGVCSRREADRFIEAGRVLIDGKPAEFGVKVMPGQAVSVDGKLIGGKAKQIVLAVNKPVGIICTEDSGTKNNIIRFLNFPERVTYAGRLDKDSDGLLLMTNDGDLINQLMRARNRHEKEYVVTVNREVTEEFVRKMAAGVHIVDEEKGLDAVTRPCTVEKLGKKKFRIVLTQGLNRQIRRMCEALGAKVVTLTRVRIMNIELGDLKTGAWREIKGSELSLLEEMIRTSGAESDKSGRKGRERR